MTVGNPSSVDRRRSKSKHLHFFLKEKRMSIFFYCPFIIFKKKSFIFFWLSRKHGDVGMGCAKHLLMSCGLIKVSILEVFQRHCFEITYVQVVITTL